jgi:hypothetical protein
VFYSFFPICSETDLIVSVLSVVRYGLQNELKNLFLVSRNIPNEIKFRFVSVRTENYFVCFIDILVFMFLFCFCFRFVSKQIYLFRLFRYGFKIPKQFFLFPRNKSKN